jgi:hypothetical protein
LLYLRSLAFIERIKDVEDSSSDLGVDAERFAVLGAFCSGLVVTSLKAFN